MTKPRIDFYGETPITKPILAYRVAARALQKGEDRRGVIEELVQRLVESKDEGFRKFKFFLPGLLRDLLTPEEAAEIEARLKTRRARASQLKMVYADCADEFSLDPAFLASVLDVERGPEVRADGVYFTMGSCFAFNIATYLAASGRKAAAFPLVEDLNSPLANAFILGLLRQTPAERLETLAAWVRRSDPALPEAEAAALAGAKLRQVAQLSEDLAGADCVVLTLGNVVDFFVEGPDVPRPVMDKIFPLYAAMPSMGDDSRARGVALLKKQGADLRFATTEETREAIGLCVAGLRAATRAPIVVTVSPVPLSMALGVGGVSAASAIEADCVSKSRLRAALDDVLPRLQAEHGAVFYYPAFEIVRWIAPTLPMHVFGRTDGGARHPSSKVIEAVCRLFVERFVRAPAGSAAAAGQAAATQRHDDDGPPASL